MSVFDATGALQGFQFTFSTPVDDLSFQTQVTATATEYSWTSPDNHLVTATGTFAGATGIVTAVTIDLANNGVDDILITAVPNASLADMLLDFSTLWSEMFGAVDTFDLTSSFSMEFMGDFFFQAGGIGGADSFIGTPDDEVTIYGDHWGLNGTATGGNDTFDVTLSAGTEVASFYGDTDIVLSGENYTGGDDEIIISRTVLRTVTAHGDAQSVLGGSLFGGNDHLEQNDTHDDLLTSLFGDTHTINSGGQVVGGNDTLISAGKLYGDASSVGAASDITCGDDDLSGLIGNDWIHGDIDIITNDSDTASGFAGGDDRLNGNDGKDQMWGDIRLLMAGSTITLAEMTFGNDLVFGGGDGDQIWGDWDEDQVGILATAGGNDTLDGGLGDDNIYGNGGNDRILGGADRDDIYGGAGQDRIFGGDDVDFLYGDAGNDTLEGGSSDDALDGGADNDTLIGGTNNDNYYVTSGDTIIEKVNEGFDWVFSADTFTLAADDNIEFMSAVDQTALTAVTLTGNALWQTITGSAAGDTLADGGGVGEDVLVGLAGNDTYIIRVAGAVITEVANNGTADRAAVGVSYVLAADDDIEVMTTTSLAGLTVINLTGNALAQAITGNAANNTLTDAAGAADTLTGSLGDDTYIVRAAGTVINEIAGGGTADKVSAALSFTLAADDDIEIMTTTSLAGLTVIDLTGNALAQSITGNAANNTLTDASGAADTLAGSLGDDTYIVRTAGTQINEIAGNGTADKVAAAVSFVLAADDDIEVMTTTNAGGLSVIDLTGNALAQSITGNAANNVLTDAAGAADTLSGSFGDDTYIVRTAGTQINEGAGTGTADKVAAAVSFVLAADDDIEVMTTTSLAGTGAINLTGNAGNQSITGNAGNNRIDGGGGSDTLTGHTGQDVFVFGAALDGLNIATLTDFTIADDSIELDDAVFSALALGAVASTAFVVNTTGLASTIDHRLIYDEDDGNLYYDADGTGAGARVQFAVLDTGLALTNLDFLVV